MRKSRFFTIVGLVSLVLVCYLEPSLANKFTTIGGGVAGDRSEKVMLLRNLFPYVGGFMILVGLLALMTRRRFEGLVGMVTGKPWEAVTIIPLLLILAGSILIGIYLF